MSASLHLQNFRGVHDQVIEQVGSYDPMLNEHNEHLVALNFDRIQFWLKKGTIATEPVANIFGKYCGESAFITYYVLRMLMIYDYAGLAGLFPIPPKLYMKAWRKRARMNNKEAEVAETQTESK